MQPVSAGFVVRLNYDDRGSANAKGDRQIENNKKKSEKTQVHMANLNVTAFQKDQLSPE